MSDGIQELLDQRQAALDKGRQIVDDAARSGRDITASENLEITELLSEAESLRVQITDAQAGWGKLPMGRYTYGGGKWTAEPKRRSGQAYQLTGLAEPTRVPCDPFGGGSNRFDSLFGQTHSSGQFHGMGDFLNAVGNAPQHHDNRLVPAATAFAGMMEGVDSAGGFAVPVEFAREIIAGTLEKSFMLSNCDVRRMTTNELRVPAFDDADHSAGLLYGGISATWKEEGGQPDASTPKLRQLALKPRKLFILVQVSSELLADSASMEDELGSKLADAAAFFVDDAMIASGTGAATPLAVLNCEGVVEVDPEDGHRLPEASGAAAGREDRRPPAAGTLGSYERVQRLPVGPSAAA